MKILSRHNFKNIQINKNNKQHKDLQDQQTAWQHHKSSLCNSTYNINTQLLKMSFYDGLKNICHDGTNDPTATDGM